MIAHYAHSLSDGSVISTPTSRALRSPTQIVTAIESEQHDELESMIRELEDENRGLQQEYDRLRLTNGSIGSTHSNKPNSQGEP